MHTTVSDGTDSPQAIIARVREAGIGLFSVTDHDAVKAARIIPGLRGADDPRFLSGVEFSCRDSEGKYHILGYGFAPDAPAIRAVTDRGHALRMEKVRARLDFLAERFGFAFSEADLAELMAQDNPGKPHIGNLMVRYGYCATKEEAIKKYINQLRLPSRYIRPEEAIAGILGAGGIPVLAHPCYGSGDELILGEELHDRVKRLMDFGLRGLEAFYSGFSAKLRGQVLALAERYALLITAGSDYHGTNKLVRLGDTGLEAPWPRGLYSFLEEIEQGGQDSI